MKVIFNNKKVANSLKQLKTKIRNVSAGVTNDSIISVLYKSGTEIKYKVKTLLFETKKKKCTNVKFIKL